MKLFYILLSLFALASLLSSDAQAQDALEWFAQDHPDYKAQPSTSNSNGIAQLDSIVVTNAEQEVVEKTVYSYNEESRLKLHDFYSIREGQLTQIWTHLYEYNDKGQLKSQEQWRSVNGVLSPARLDVYDYNDEGLQSQVEYFQYDPLTFGYLESTLEVFNYDEGLLRRIDISNYDPEKATYEQFRFLDLEYNENDLETLRTEVNILDNGLEIPSARFVRSYDEDKLIAMNFDVWSNEWIPFQTTRIEYANGQLSDYVLTGFNPNQPGDTAGLFTIFHEAGPSGLIENRELNIRNENGTQRHTTGSLEYNENLAFSDLTLPFILRDPFYGYDLHQAQLLKETSEVTNGNGEIVNLVTDYYWSSTMTNTDDVAYKSTIDIWPNPASELLQWKAKSELDSYVIQTTSGKAVMAGKSDGHLSIEHLPAGVYVLLLLEKHEGRRSVFIKQ